MCGVTMDDRISRLPDEILSHILSFLSTKQVVTTSVISKRWRPLWLFVPTLYFDDQRFPKKSNSSFINFVYAAIFSRYMLQPIKEFTLICNCPYSVVKIWLTAVIQHQVENLEIYSSSHVPCNIFVCTTLVVLKLSGMCFPGVISSVDLPLLKTLYLDNVEYLNPQVLMELFGGCPILEVLEAVDVSVYDSSFEGEFKISLPKLVRADVYDLLGIRIPVKSFCNLKILRLDELDQDIPVFTNLIHMELKFRVSVTWSLVLDMLNHCPKLQTLILDDLYCADDDEVWPYPNFVPECFSSHFRKCFLKCYRGEECEMRFANYVMQNSTSIRTMTIHSGPRQNDKKKLQIIKELASCPRSSTICELLFE